MGHGDFYHKHLDKVPYTYVYGPFLPVVQIAHTGFLFRGMDTGLHPVNG